MRYRQVVAGEGEIRHRDVSREQGQGKLDTFSFVASVPLGSKLMGT